MKSETSSRGFLRGALLGLALVGGLWLLMLAGQLGSPVPGTHWVEKAYEYKLAQANTIQQPKVLVVAGSAAMFGVDSTAVAEALGRPVVNLGVNAGILPPTSRATPGRPSSPATGLCCRWNTRCSMVAIRSTCLSSIIGGDTRGFGAWT